MRSPSKHILIVGSDSTLRDLLCEVVRQEVPGIEVHSARSVPEAVLTGRHRAPDVLVVDASLSGTDGIEIIERVQAVHPGTQAILITAADRDEMRERGRLRAASFALFSKPFSIDAFLQHVSTLIGHQAPQAGTALQTAWTWA